MENAPILFVVMALAAAGLWPLVYWSERRAARQRVANLARYGEADAYPTVYALGADKELHAGKAVAATSSTVSVYFNTTFLGVRPGHIEDLPRRSVFNLDGSAWGGDLSPGNP